MLLLEGVDKAAFRTWLLASCVVEDKGFISPCWMWQRETNERGYARWSLPKWIAGSRARRCRVHRVAYQVLVGAIPDGLVTDHLCRNRACVNPEHLEPVTIGENNRRSIRNGVSGGNRLGCGNQYSGRTHCHRGHEYTPATTRMNPNGSRTCRICHADYMREYMRGRPRKRRRARVMSEAA